MINVEYANAYAEILEILKFVSIEDYNKIPIDEIELYKTYANKNHDFQYNPNKSLDEQNVSKIAKAIIGLLFRDYWATEIQRQKILAKQNYELQKIEKKKLEKYNPCDLFKNNKSEKDENNVKDVQSEFFNDNMRIIEYKKQKWYKKIFEKILDILKLKK